ncbi:hypothetical protein AAMO2058_001547800 [Amorphochlora amoebiformis]
MDVWIKKGLFLSSHPTLCTSRQHPTQSQSRIQLYRSARCHRFSTGTRRNLGEQDVRRKIARGVWVRSEEEIGGVEGGRVGDLISMENLFAAQMKLARGPWDRVLVLPEQPEAELKKGSKKKGKKAGSGGLTFVFSNERQNISRLYKGGERRSKLDVLEENGILELLIQTTDGNSIRPIGDQDITLEEIEGLEQWRDVSREMITETPIPFLEKLGVMHPDGKVKRPHYSKFVQVRQILNFLLSVGPMGITFAGTKKPVQDWLPDSNRS